MLMFHESEQLSCSQVLILRNWKYVIAFFSDGTLVHIHSTLALVQSQNWSVSEFLHETASTILSWTTGSFKSTFNIFSGFNDRSLPLHPFYPKTFQAHQLIVNFCKSWGKFNNLFGEYFNSIPIPNWLCNLLILTNL